MDRAAGKPLRRHTRRGGRSAARDAAPGEQPPAAENWECQTLVHVPGAAGVAPGPAAVATGAPTEGVAAAPQRARPRPLRRLAAALRPAARRTVAVLWPLLSLVALLAAVLSLHAAWAQSLALCAAIALPPLGARLLSALRAGPGAALAVAAATFVALWLARILAPALLLVPADIGSTAGIVEFLRAVPGSFPGACALAWQQLLAGLLAPIWAAEALLVLLLFSAAVRR
jgi:hypothetical protein